MTCYCVLYERCCLYEITVLHYFLNFSGQTVLFCSPDGKPVRTMEGFPIEADAPLSAIEPENARCLILPGGPAKAVDTPEFRALLQALREQGALLFAICAGVDVLDRAGVLDGLRSTHSCEADWIFDKNVLTARANAYVDFAIEGAKALQLFRDEEDLRETVDFWKNRKRMQ